MSDKKWTPPAYAADDEPVEGKWTPPAYASGDEVVEAVGTEEAPVKAPFAEAPSGSVSPSSLGSGPWNASWRPNGGGQANSLQVGSETVAAPDPTGDDYVAAIGKTGAKQSVAAAPDKATRDAGGFKTDASPGEELARNLFPKKPWESKDRKVIDDTVIGSHFANTTELRKLEDEYTSLQKKQLNAPPEYADQIDRRIGELSDRIVNLKKQAKETGPLVNGAVSRLIEREVQGDIGSLTQDRFGIVEASPAAVSSRARKIAERFGDPGRELYDQINAKMTGAVDAKVAEPAVNKVFQDKAKGLYDKIKQRSDSVYASYESEFAKYSTELAQAKRNAENGSKQDMAAIEERFNRQVGELDAELKTKKSAIEELSARLSDGIQAGRISSYDAQAQYKAAEADYNSMVEGRNKEVARIQGELEAEANKVRSIYNERFASAQRGILDRVNERIKAANAAVAKSAELTNEERNELTAMYADSWRQVMRERQAAVDITDKTLWDNIASANPFAAAMTRFGQTTLQALGGSIKRTSHLVDSRAGQALGAEMERMFLRSSVSTKEWSDLLDLYNFSGVSGQLAGGMLPSIAASGGAAWATGGLGGGVALQLLTSAASGWGSETMDIMGGIRETVYNETGDADKADEAARKAFMSQVQLLPAYAFEGLPFIEGALKKVRSRAVRVAVGAGTEYITELFQELPQNIAEDNITKGLEPWDNFWTKLQGPETKETMIQMAPIVFLGGAGHISDPNKELERHVRAYMGKAINTVSANGGTAQWIGRMVEAQGSEFAEAVIASMYASGHINEETAKMLGEAHNVHVQGMKDAKDSGLAKPEAGVYAAFMAKALDMERLSQQDGISERSANALRKQAEALRGEAEGMLTGGQSNHITVTYPDGATEILTDAEARALFSDPEYMAKMALLNMGRNDFKYTASGTSVKLLDQFYTDLEAKTGEIRAQIKEAMAPKPPAPPQQEGDKAKAEQKAREKAAHENVAMSDEARDELIRAREKLGVVFDPLDDLPDDVVRTSNRLDDGLPVDPVALDEASNWLYSKYRQIQAMRTDPHRLLTHEQIDGYLEELGKEIERIEDHKQALQDAADGKQRPDKQPEATREEEAPAAPKEEPSGEVELGADTKAAPGNVGPQPEAPVEEDDPELDDLIDDYANWTEPEDTNRIEQNGAAEDNLEQEPIIAAIESQAESNGEADLVEAAAEADGIIKAATGIYRIQVGHIFLDPERFQNRDEIDEDHLEKIAHMFDDNEFDPIVVWVDPADGKRKLLAGHHRFAAAKLARQEYVTVRDFKGSEAEAIRFAKKRSNANRLMETPLERAKYYRNEIADGRSPKEVEEEARASEGRNARYILNLMALNPTGVTADALRALKKAEDRVTQRELEKIADFIGEARRKYPALTNAHEQEMFTFLMRTKEGANVRTKADFIKLVHKVAGGIDFNPDVPLNIRRSVYKSGPEQQYDKEVSELKEQIREQQDKVDDLKARFNDPRHKEYVAPSSRNYTKQKEIADNLTANLNAEIRALQAKLLKLHQDKGRYLDAGKAEVGLFDELESEEETPAGQSEDKEQAPVEEAKDKAGKEEGRTPKPPKATPKPPKSNPKPPKDTSQQAKPDPFANNKVFTSDEVQAAMERIRQRLNHMNVGVDPRLLADGMYVAAAFIESGIRKFADYAKAMIDAFGPKIAPHLLSFWEGARHSPGVDATGMTSTEQSVKEHAELIKNQDKPNDNDTGNDSLGEEEGPADEGDGEGGGSSDNTGEEQGQRPDDILEELEPEDVPGTEKGGDTSTVRDNKTGSGGRNGEQPEGGGVAPGGRQGGGGKGAPSPNAGGRRGGRGKGKGRGDVRGETFHVDNPEALSPQGLVARFEANKAAILLLQELRAEGRPATDEEKKVLAAYSGWGSFSEELFGIRSYGAWGERAEWLKSHISEAEWDKLRESVTTSFYTPPQVIFAMWQMMDRLGFREGRVLEPSMGVGSFFALMPKGMKSLSVLTGIEIDPTTAAIAALIYPDSNIQNKPYEDTRTPDNYYDIAIGNVPFDNFSPADRKYQKLKPKLHDYFALKMLDQVRPGGVAMFITSTGTMDKKGSAIRSEIDKKAELVGAFRLPKGAFGSVAGTDVSTDIIILQKRPEPLPPASTRSAWVNVTELKVGDGKGTINQYFVDSPGSILGNLVYTPRASRWGGGLVVEQEGDLAKLLERALSSLPKDIIGAAKEKRSEHLHNQTREREGALTASDKGKFYVVQGEHLVPAEEIKKYTLTSAKQTKEREDQFSRLIDIRKKYDELLAEQRVSDATNERKALKDAYDDFVKKHGNISGSFGLNYLKAIGDPNYAILDALEVGGKPSGIFTRNTTRSKPKVENPSISDAYVILRNRTPTPAIQDIAELAKKTEEEVRQDLIERGAMFEAPNGDMVPTDIYLSGNVRVKLQEAEAALAEGNKDMERNIEALKAVLPKWVPNFWVDVSFGDSWVDIPDYVDFIAHMLRRPRLASSIDISHSPLKGWSVTFKSNINKMQEAKSGFGLPEYPFSRLVEAAMNNRTVSLTMEIMDETGRKRTVPDTENTKKANYLIEAMRAEFSQWIWADPDRRSRLEAQYNNERNSIAIPSYDGSFLTFDGMALELGRDPFNLREHQANAIWRALVTRRTLAAHEVGTGKTFTLAGVAVESRKFGIATKPLILAHNANSDALAKNINVMYPGAKVLYIDNLAPDKIATRLRQIANDDWDAVVLPHSLVDRLALKKETLEAMAAPMLEALMNDAYAIAEDDPSNGGIGNEVFLDAEKAKSIRSPKIKTLVTQYHTIRAQIEKQAAAASKADAVPFEELGIDMIIVDESHIFKKPPFSTRMDMKGMGKEVSKRSIALDLLTRYVRNNYNGNVHLFTGTPITNTLTELFHQMRYIMEDEMASMGLDMFDGWFNAFARGLTELELGATGEYKPQTRLSAFVNIPELRRLAGQYMDIVFSDSMPEMQPRKVGGKTLNDTDLTDAERDEIYNGRTEGAKDRNYKRVINEMIEMTPEQLEVFEILKGYALEWENAEKNTRKNWMLKGDERIPIRVEAIASAASYDPRAVKLRGLEPRAKYGDEGKIDDDPGSKLSRVIDRVMEVYKSHDLANQVIFLEKGYSTEVTWSQRDGEGNKLKDKKVKVFSPVNDLVERLVQQGIPREKIALVTGKVSKSERTAIADKMNSGEFRVVIGNTQSIGVGVNMQNNLRAIHHVDAPYVPSDLHQRNGRGHRQGNQWNTVLEYRYITARLDGRRWQILSRKDRFIIRFLLGQIDERTLEDELSQEEQSDIMQSFAESIGDQRVMIKLNLEGKINKIKMHRSLFERGIEETKGQKRALQEQRLDLEQSIDRLKKSGVLDLIQKTLEAQSEDFSMTVRGTEYTSRKEASAAIDAFLSKEIRPGHRNVKVGDYRGLPVTASWDSGVNKGRLDIQVNTETYRSVSLHGLESMLRGQEGWVEMRERSLKDMAERIERFNEILERPFPEADKLANLEKQYEDLLTDMQENPDPPPAWLREGAPRGTDAYYKNEPYLVVGHRMKDGDAFVMLENPSGQMAVQYRELTDRQGFPLFNDIKEQVNPKGPVATGIANVDNTVRALSEIAPGVEVVLHDNDESYDAAKGGRGTGAKSAAFYDQGPNQIHIHTGRAADNTLYHEAAHPVINAVLANSPQVIDQLYAQLEQLPGFEKYREHAGQYPGHKARAEALAEYMADVAEGKARSSANKRSAWQALKAWVTRMLNRLGFAKVNLDTTDVAKFAEGFAKAIAQGVAIRNPAPDAQRGRAVEEQIRSGRPYPPDLAASFKRKGYGTDGARNYMERRGMRPSMIEAVLAAMGNEQFIFSMSDDMLGDYFAQIFGDDQRTGGTSRKFSNARNAQFLFRGQDHFNQWMRERFDEGDLDGMREAFVEAESATKVKYVRHVQRTGTADEKAWASHLGKGSPLPPGKAPVARTTPRPLPQGGFQGTNNTPPTPPNPPRPAKPRPASNRATFNLTAMIQLLEEFEITPTIDKKLRRALATVRGDDAGVALVETLLYNKALAERVIAHEIGHIVDGIIESGRGKRGFASRIAPLNQFAKDLKRELNSEAVALSQAWGGTFTKDDKERNSASELFADAFSAMLNDPEWVNQNFPKIYDTFNDLLQHKPDFRDAYDELTRRLAGQGLIEAWERSVDSARKASVDTLMQKYDPSRESKRGQIKGQFISPWYRIMQIEGKERNRDIGLTSIDQLEISNMFHLRENALFESDFWEFAVPQLKKVDEDGEKASTYLNRYIIANRVIEERRLSGQWFERKPNEARQLLLSLAEMHPALAGFKTEVYNIRTGEEAYDLAGRMVQAVVLRDKRASDGEKVPVTRNRDALIAAIDAADIGLDGENVMMAFNVRGNLLNPHGLTPETAKDAVARLEKELGPERYAALQQAQREISNLLYQVQKAAYEEGLFSETTFKEIIEPNKASYAPFAVLDYWGGRVGAGIAAQVGTAKGVADTMLATQMKVAAINNWRKNNHITAMLHKAYVEANAADRVEIGPPLKRASDLEDIRKRHMDDDKSRLVLWQNGTPRLVTFSGDPGKSFEEAARSQNVREVFGVLTEHAGLAMATMQLYTVLTPNFWLRNIPRGWFTSMGRIGTRAVLRTTFSRRDQLLAMRMAWNYAMASRGTPMIPEVKHLMETGVLNPPRYTQAMSLDIDSQRMAMAGGIMMAFDHKKYVGRSTWWGRTLFKRYVVDSLVTASNMYEGYEKIMNYLAISRRPEANERKRIGVAMRSGIPKSGVAGRNKGLNMAMELMFPWTRVSLQGERSNVDIWRDPDLGAGYRKRLAMFEVLPRVIDFAAGAGALSVIASMFSGDDGGDDDDNDSGVREMARVLAVHAQKVSPYKAGLDRMLPLAFYDPRTGEYTPLFHWAGKEVPDHIEAVSLRIPSSEEGRIWMPLLYSMMANSSEKMKVPGRGTAGLAADWAMGTLMPGPNPIISSLWDAGVNMAIRGENPTDNFTHGPMANPLLFDAGWGYGRGDAIVGSTLSKLGGPGAMAGQLLTSTGVIDKRAVHADKERLSTDKTPLADRIRAFNAFISYDNAIPRRERAAERDAEQARKTARSAMSPEVYEMYQFYHRNVKHKDKLDKYDQVKFKASEIVVREVWGNATVRHKNERGEPAIDTLKYGGANVGMQVPGMPFSRNLYGKSLDAVGRNSSKELMKGIRQEIDEASAPYKAIFDDPDTFLEMTRPHAKEKEK